LAFVAFFMSRLGVEMVSRLREIRKAKGMSMLELAVKARVSTATLSMVERFAYLPGQDIMARISAALGVPVGYIWPEQQAGAASGGTGAGQ
jgi:transcriptional regulator with XRE-family HTH domain